MSIIAWIVCGLVVGVIANIILKGEAYFQNLVLGGIGGIIGGWLFSTLGAAGTGFSASGLLFAAVGSGVALLGYHGFHRGRY